MKSRLNPLTTIALLSGMVLCTSTIQSASIPDYRGKVVLIVDQTIAANNDVSNKLIRLTADLAGDGWRVLRHDVERGKDPVTQNADWRAQVRQVRALIKADYDAAPTEVKSVFLIGHVAVPYSGDTTVIVGGHSEVEGAHPADSFYGEMTSAYGDGWRDFVADINWTPFPNTPGDGRFDQSSLPSSPELAVGRVDLSKMEAFHIGGVDEAKLISRYLDRDHDFRCGTNFVVVQRRALDAGFDGHTFCSFGGSFNSVFGAANVNHICNLAPHWFPNVQASGQDYLIGFGAGWGWTACQPRCAAGIGGTSSTDTHPDVEWSLYSQQNNFLDFNSRVVFVNLYGSYFGSWDQQNSFLRAPLANPYDPSNAKYGYGLGVVWYNYDLGQTTLAAKAQGATIGEAPVTAGVVQLHATLMGDPTLRWHTVRQIPSLTATKTTTIATLTWTASPDAANGYRIYRAPTLRGPYTYVADVGSVTTYDATRPLSSDPTYPDNYYMVRAKTTENPASGTTGISAYDNMSVGGIVKLSGGIPSYYKIQSGPANQVAAVGDSVAFSVDALGITAVGTEKIYYQWYKNGVAIPANDTSIMGGTTNAIIIKNVQSSDAGTYTVYVSLTPGINPKTASATLAVSYPPVAVNDTYLSLIRNTPIDLSILDNDTDGDTPNGSLTIDSMLTLYYVGSVWVNPGDLSIVQPQKRLIRYVPERTFLGSAFFHYLVSDGSRKAGAKVSFTVIPHPDNQQPTISAVANQTMEAFEVKNLNFTVGDPDGYTLPDNLKISVSYSSATAPNMLSMASLTITGTGANRTLKVKAGALVGTGTVTIRVEDEDLGVNTTSFQVTVNPANVPGLYGNNYANGVFNFQVIGPANASVEIKSSDDLLLWTTVGKGTISANNVFCFADHNAAISAQRFYVASRQGFGDSLNAIGLIKRTIPSMKRAPISVPLANPGGNRPEVLVPNLPSSGYIGFLSNDNDQYESYNLEIPNAWYVLDFNPANSVNMNPGSGVYFENGTPSDFELRLIGDIPQGSFQRTMTLGSIDNGSILPLAGSIPSLGFAPVTGDMVAQWNTPADNWYPTLTYSGSPTPGWSPSVPTIGIAEGFFFNNVVTQPRTWTQNLSVCPPDVAVSSPASGSYFVGPLNISLAAAAIAHPGHDTSHSVASVEFYNGATLIGQGTFSGGTYNLTSNNVAAGTYTITARAKDNSVYTGVPNGFTTISAPVTITVLSAASPTLSGGNLSGNNFTFTIKGTSGAQVGVYATTDFANWTSLGSVTLSGGVGTAVDSSASSFGHRFYGVKHGSVCAANSLGFIKVTVPGKVGGTGGEAWIANQLDNPTGNTLDVILPSVPSGTVLNKYDPVTGSYETATFSGTSWCPANMILNPGEGARIYNPSTSPLTLTFIGAVRTGQLNVALPPGFALVSSPFPKSANLMTQGIPALEGDELQRLVTASQQIEYRIFDGTQWLDNTTGDPVIVSPAVSEAFFYFNAGSTARTWTQNITVCPP